MQASSSPVIGENSPDGATTLGRTEAIGEEPFGQQQDPTAVMGDTAETMGTVRSLEPPTGDASPQGTKLQIDWSRELYEDTLFTPLSPLSFEAPLWMDQEPSEHEMLEQDEDMVSCYAEVLWQEELVSPHDEPEFCANVVASSHAPDISSVEEAQSVEMVFERPQQKSAIEQVPSSSLPSSESMPAGQRQQQDEGQNPQTVQLSSRGGFLLPSLRQRTCPAQSRRRVRIEGVRRRQGQHQLVEAAISIALRSVEDRMSTEQLRQLRVHLRESIPTLLSTTRLGSLKAPGSESTLF